MFKRESSNREKWKVILKQLQNNDKIKSVTLKNIPLNDSDAEQLALAIQHHTSLIKLDLRENKIGDSGAKKLAEAIQHNTTLKELWLYKNDIGELGIKYFAQALLHNTTLSVLQLGSTDALIPRKISNACVKVIAQALSHNNTLTGLILHNYTMSDDSAKELAQALQHNTSLTTFMMDAQNISKHCAKQMVQILQPNTTLVDFRLIKAGFTSSITYDEFNPVLQRNQKYRVELYNAAKDNDSKAVGELVQTGANLLSFKGKEENTPLHWAVMLGHRKLTWYLLETMRIKKLPIDKKNYNGKTAEDLAQNTLLYNYFNSMANYKWISSTYNEILNNPQSLSMDLLQEMFDYADNIYLFRFPYSLACMFRELNLKDQKEIDTIIIQALKDIALHRIKGPRVYALFTKVILRSAVNQGILDPITKAEIAKIADNTDTFADDRFQEIVNKVGKLQKEMETTQQNVQQLAAELNNLKRALKRKAQLEMVFSVAKIAFVFGGGHVLDALAGVANLASIAEISSVIFKIPAEDVMQALKSGQELLLDQAAEAVLKKVGIDPNEFIETWQETALVLQSPVVSKDNKELESAAQPMLQKLHFQPPPLASLQIKQSAIFSPLSFEKYVQPKISISSNDFTAWLKDIQSQGSFNISHTDKNVQIHFSSSDKTNDEIEEVLFELDDQLKKLPEFQSIDLEERDTENNCLMLTTKTKVDAKKLLSILEKYYELNATTQISRLELVK